MMSISYRCRSCKHQLAEFAHLTQEMSQSIQSLTQEERMHILTEDGYGNIEIAVLCDYCQEALLHHPELSLLQSPLQ